MRKLTRGEFITLLGGATVAWPLTARAQQPAMPAKRIGALVPYAEDDPETQIRVAAFRQGLDRLGWSNGRNIRIELRFNAVTMRRLANETRRSASRFHPDRQHANDCRGAPVRDRA
jgi:hypothetical protein